MSDYKITKYSIAQAKKLQVDIQPSSNPKKKIDIYKNGKKIASIGDVMYSDFATTQDKERRRLYKIRHNKTRKIVGSNSYFADKILW